MGLAARGQRETADGTVAIEDEGERQALRGVSRGILWRATMLAAIGTAIALLLPA